MELKFNDYEPKDIIRIIREWTEETQKDFGKSIGKSTRTIQDYEAGRRRYYVETLEQICKAYGINIIIEKKNDKKKRIVINND